MASPDQPPTKRVTGRFVVLRHEMPAGGARPTHWDFMLEAGESLRTWALACEPAGGDPIAAEALAEHRLAYLDYEGPVSGDRGHVTRWDRGTYRMSSESPNHVIVELSGERLRGVASFARQDTTEQWKFRFSYGRSATSDWAAASPA